MWHLWWTKGRWGRFSPNTFVSPANYHSTDFSTFIIIIIIVIWGWYNRRNSGRGTTWTLTPREKK
jgi:hypothetical protein